MRVVSVTFLRDLRRKEGLVFAFGVEASPMAAGGCARRGLSLLSTWMRWECCEFDRRGGC